MLTPEAKHSPSFPLLTPYYLLTQCLCICLSFYSARNNKGKMKIFVFCSVIAYALFNSSTNRRLTVGCLFWCVLNVYIWNWPVDTFLWNDLQCVLANGHDIDQILTLSVLAVHRTFFLLSFFCFRMKGVGWYRCHASSKTWNKKKTTAKIIIGFVIISFLCVYFCFYTFLSSEAKAEINWEKFG